MEIKDTEVKGTVVDTEISSENTKDTNVEESCCSGKRKRRKVRNTAKLTESIIAGANIRQAIAESLEDYYDDSENDPEEEILYTLKSITEDDIRNELEDWADIESISKVEVKPETDGITVHVVGEADTTGVTPFDITETITQSKWKFVTADKEKQLELIAKIILDAII